MSRKIHILSEFSNSIFSFLLIPKRSQMRLTISFVSLGSSSHMQEKYLFAARGQRSECPEVLETISSVELTNQSGGFVGWSDEESVEAGSRSALIAGNSS